MVNLSKYMQDFYIEITIKHNMIFGWKLEQDHWVDYRFGLFYS